MCTDCAGGDHSPGGGGVSNRRGRSPSPGDLERRSPSKRPRSPPASPGKIQIVSELSQFMSPMYEHLRNLNSFMATHMASSGTSRSSSSDVSGKVTFGDVKRHPRDDVTAVDQASADDLRSAAPSSQCEGDLGVAASADDHRSDVPSSNMIVLLEVLLVDLPRQLTRRSVFVSHRDSPTADDHPSEALSSQRDRSPRGASRRSSSSAHS